MSGRLVVRPMTPAEFEVWVALALAQFAEAVTAARGVPPEVGARIAAESHARLLPEGLASPGTRIVVGEDEAGRRVGILWVGPPPDGAGPAWVYEIEVEESRRGEGWGRALMQAAEELAREEGHTEIGLNVFGSNTVARRLYESLGYEAASIQMRKAL